MSYAKKFLATGAAGMLLAAGGAVPAMAAPRAAGALSTPVGSVFSGVVEGASGESILVERRQRKPGASPVLVAVDTDAATVVSRAGQALPLEAIAHGAEVIVSGTKSPDGTILASKILIRT
jgi:hypothetical protein